MSGRTHIERSPQHGWTSKIYMVEWEMKSKRKEETNEISNEEHKLDKFDVLKSHPFKEKYAHLRVCIPFDLYKKDLWFIIMRIETKQRSSHSEHSFGIIKNSNFIISVWCGCLDFGYFSLSWYFSAFVVIYSSKWMHWMVSKSFCHGWCLNICGQNYQPMFEQKIAITQNNNIDWNLPNWCHQPMGGGILLYNWNFPFTGFGHLMTFPIQHINTKLNFLFGKWDFFVDYIITLNVEQAAWIPLIVERELGQWWKLSVFFMNFIVIFKR